MEGDASVNLECLEFFGTGGSLKIQISTQHWNNPPGAGSARTEEQTGGIHTSQHT